MKLITYNSRRSRAGFSLVEILVVLVIASILAAVTLGGYSAMRASNSRTSCQANMAQIYQAIRLYATDYDGMAPYYNPDPTNQSIIGQGKGLGLWALYTYASDSDFTLPAGADIKPEKRYLTNAKLFHCPSDIADNDEQMFSDSANSVYNPNYLSYQTSDTGCPDPSDNACSSSDGNYGTAQFTYNPVRSVPTNISALDQDWQRQLLHYYKDAGNVVSVERPPTDDTVILWCPFHRGHGSVSTDNVLFWDGTLQSIPEAQVCSSVTLVGAQRVPLDSCK